VRSSGRPAGALGFRLILMSKSLIENSKGRCFRRNGRMARRDEGKYPWRIFDWGATNPGGHFFENPSGGGSFARGQRWLGPYSPHRGCSAQAALAPAKIPHRSTPCNFQTGSNTTSL